VNVGDELIPLLVVPDPGVPERYARASGDFNPIHTDPAAATAAGLPGVILHGLYTMAQVARANVAAAGGDPRTLQRLAVEFRAPGFPGREIAITGEVAERRDGRLVVRCTAAQGKARIARRCEAELRPAPA
jgi:acyl dehydratase